MGRLWTWLRHAWAPLLFCVAFVTLLREHGTSPAIWPDTLVDDSHVLRCVHQDDCTTIGVGATVGIFHTVGYLHFRALQVWLGFDADDTYRMLLAATALGLVLTTLATKRLAGGAAAALSAVLCWQALGVPVQGNVISDVAPLPALGAAFLFVAVAAAQRRDWRLTAALAVFAGVMANVYATGLFCGVSAVLVALLHERRRWRMAAVAAALFVITAFCIGPGTWIVDAQILMSRRVGNAQVGYPRGAFELGTVRLATGALALSALAIWFRRPAFKLLAAPLAVFLPLYLPLVLGPLVSVLEPQEKYAAHAVSAIALGFAVAVAQLVSAARQAWAAAPWMRTAERFAERARPWAPLLLLVPVLGAWSSAIRARGGTLRFAELNATVRALAERGWDRNRAYRDLRTPDEVVRQSTLHWTTAGWPEQSRASGLEQAFLVRTRAEWMPAHIPPDVVVFSPNVRETAVVAFACSWIDWRAFTACVKDARYPDGVCNPSGYPVRTSWEDDLVAPGMPMPDVARDRAPQSLTLELPLHPSESCPTQDIFMPEVGEACPGRIVAVEGSDASIDARGKRVRLERTARGPTKLVLRWELGGPDCFCQYRGQPPFFVAGPPATTAFVASLLDDRSDPKPRTRVDLLGRTRLERGPKPRMEGPTRPSLAAPPIVAPPLAQRMRIDMRGGMGDHSIKLRWALLVALFECVVVVGSVASAAKQLQRSPEPQPGA